jgi:endo-1,4-beta-xylanase
MLFGDKLPALFGFCLLQPFKERLLDHVLAGLLKNTFPEDLKSKLLTTETSGPVCTWLPPLKVLCAVITSVLTAGADEQDAGFSILPRGSSLIAADSLQKTRVKSQFGSVEPVAIEGKDIHNAIRISTDKRPPHTYSFQLRLPTSAAVKQGAALLAVFDARAVKLQQDGLLGETEFVFEMATAPFTKSVAHPVHFGAHWQRFYIPFEAKADYAAGEAAVIFRAGYEPQTIEIGGIKVIDFSASAPLAKLPHTPATYIGREPYANWRKVAAERIELLRKGELKVTVTGPDGAPLRGAKVRAHMKRQSFVWGSAVDARILLGHGPDHDRYREILARDFNSAVLENDMKWSAWGADPQRSMDAVAWLRRHDMAVRGHVLLWPGRKNLPSNIVGLLDQPELLRASIIEHITQQAGAFRGQLVEWDVVNEPFTEFDVQTALSGVKRGDGTDYIERHAATLAPFFHAARAADPEVKLDINDYSILETGGKDLAHQDHYERTIRALIAGGAPIGGIGIQGHFSEDLTPIPKLWKILDRFTQFGLPIQITEFDVNTHDEALQADYTRDFLTAMFAHPGVRGVLVWGFWEKRHWIPNAAFFRADWSLRPAGQVWLDLVRGQWCTEEEGETDARGEWRIRGFHGDYVITVQDAQKSAEAHGSLAPEGVEFKITLR